MNTGALSVATTGISIKREWFRLKPYILTDAGKQYILPGFERFFEKGIHLIAVRVVELVA